MTCVFITNIGGSDTVRSKLSETGLGKLLFEVHSDPEWKLMTAEPSKQIYVPFDPPAVVKQAHYRMVQPALVVLNPKGEVVYWWSWNKLKPGFVCEDGVLPNAKTSSNPTGSTHDVRYRPNPADLLSRYVAHMLLTCIVVLPIPKFRYVHINSKLIHCRFYVALLYNVTATSFISSHTVSDLHRPNLIWMDCSWRTSACQFVNNDITN